MKRRFGQWSGGEGDSGEKGRFVPIWVWRPLSAHWAF